MAGQLTEPGGLSGARSADEQTPSDQALAAEAPTRSPSRFADRVPLSLAFAVALVAAITPVVVATVRAIDRDWLPSSDTGYLPLRAWDVFSSHPPLIGPPASASDQVGRDLYQPGALQYDLLAVPVRLFGRGPGTAVTIALVNVVAIVLIGWLLRRLLGVIAATVALAATALLVWSMGSEILYDPWATYSPLLAFALLMVAVWCAVAGDVVAWPVVIVAGSYVAQVHLSFAVLVAGLVVFAVVGCVLRLRQGRRLDPAGWAAVRAQAGRWGAGSIVLGLVCWSQPLWQQFFGSGEGNLGALARSTSSDLSTPGLSQALRTLGGTVALPPFWFPPSFGSPSFDADGDGVSLGLAVAALAVLVVALGMIGVRAHRRGAVALAAGAATALTSLALGLATMLRVPLTYGLTAHYVRWMWPLGMVLWLVLALGGLEEIRLARRARAGTASPAEIARSPAEVASPSGAGASSPAQNALSPAAAAAYPSLAEAAVPSPGRGSILPLGRVVAGAAALVAVVAGIGALPKAENGTSTVPWTSSSGP